MQQRVLILFSLGHVGSYKRALEQDIVEVVCLEKD